MKLMMPIDTLNETSKVAALFGRASDFLIYDTESKKKTMIANPATQKQGGAGILAAQTVIDQGIEVAIVPQCGENAMNLFRQAHVDVYQSVGTDIDENIQKFINNELSLLSHAHPGMHHHP